MTIEIRNHRIFVNGAAVAYRATPNVGRALKPEGIILHDTAGDLAGIGSIEWLCNPAAKASAHVVIDRGGKITQLAPLNVQTWHAGKSVWQGRQNVNGFAIGIEIANPGKMVKVEGGYSNDSRPGKGVRVSASMNVQRVKTAAHGDGFWLSYTPAQIEAVTALCLAIRQTYGVTFIGTHWQISPGRKVDVNPRFPLETVKRSVFDRPRYALVDDAAEAGLSKFEVEAIQRRLRDLGYYETGLIDGKMQSSMTAAFAAFQRDNGLPVTGEYDDATREALAFAQPRIVSPQRAEATADDLRDAGSRTIGEADKIGIVGKVMAWFGLGTAGAVGADKGGVLPLDRAQEAIEKVQQARTVWDSVSDLAAGIFRHPATPLIAIGLCIAGYLILRSVKAIVAARVDDHRTGKNRAR